MQQSSVETKYTSEIAHVDLMTERKHFEDMKDNLKHTRDSFYSLIEPNTAQLKQINLGDSKNITSAEFNYPS